MGLTSTVLTDAVHSGCGATGTYGALREFGAAIDASENRLRNESDFKEHQTRWHCWRGFLLLLATSVPKSVGDATALLDDVGRLLSAGQWGTAAIVWTFTEDG